MDDIRVTVVEQDGDIDALVDQIERLSKDNYRVNKDLLLLGWPRRQMILNTDKRGNTRVLTPYNG